MLYALIKKNNPCASRREARKGEKIPICAFSILAIRHNVQNVRAEN